MKYKSEELEKMAVHLSQRERVAQKASRDSVKYKQCQYLMDKLGKIYTGVITSVQDYGLFVEIPENGCEGLVKTSDIGYKTWTPDVKNHCFTEEITGRKMRLGDEIKIIIKSIDLEKKEINLSVLDIY
jgi:ribonuclease R